MMNSYKLLLIVVFIFASSCTRKTDGTSTLKIAFSGSASSSKLSPYSSPGEMISQSVSTQSTSNTVWNESLNPTAVAQVNCVVVAVGGPETEMRRNRCWNSTKNFYLGKWIGGVPVNFSAGTSAPASIEVPSGPQRNIFIIGFRSANGACTNFKVNEMDENNLSHPIVLGSTTQDLSPGDVTVNLGATVTASSEKIDDCEGPDFGTGPKPLYFGDASDGNQTLSGGESFIGSTIAGAHAKIIGINIAPISPNEDTVELSLASVASFSNFQANDEVMIIVNGGRLGTPPGHSDLSACGFKAHPGTYMFGRLKTATAGTPNKLFVHKGTFLDKLHYDPPSQTFMGSFWAALSARLAAASDNVTDFCYMQVVRVPHFNNLTLNETRIINAEPFNYDIYGGGIVAFRVNGTLTLKEDSGINANYAGFKKFAAKVGAGILGNASESCSDATTSSTHNGGTCATGATGAGGGGHGVPSGTPIMSQISGGSSGSGSQEGGYAVGDDCNTPSCYASLNNKMFMGGAGGSTSGADGGSGGGIVFIMARNIVTATVSTTTPASIMAAGQTGANASASHSGAGAGAGGSIFLGYQSLNLTGSVDLNLAAVGGSGGINNVSPPQNSGGGGAGGRIQIMSCSGVLPNLYMVNGNGGGSIAGKNGTYYFPPSTPTCL